MQYGFLLCLTENICGFITAKKKLLPVHQYQESPTLKSHSVVISLTTNSVVMPWRQIASGYKNAWEKEGLIKSCEKKIDAKYSYFTMLFYTAI